MKLKSLVWLAPLLMSQVITRIFPIDQEWYNQITENVETPAPVVFAIVWPILYILIGLTFYNTNDTGAKKILLVNLVLNYLWLVFFNYFQDILLGLIVLVLMVLTLYFYFKTEWTQKSMLLIPYFIWLLYATYLNYQIYMEN